MMLDCAALANKVEIDEINQVGKTIGTGLTVSCNPYPLEPGVIHQQNRTVCLVRPYETCTTCRHSAFTLVFSQIKQSKYEQILCPKWANPEDRMNGLPPTDYCPTEISTCQKHPFEFCPSCPSIKNVEHTGADKHMLGWYGRWKRLSRNEDG